MKTHIVTLIAALSLASSFAQAAENKPAASEAQQSFDRLKGLVGEWEAETPMGKTHLTYELVSAGNALVERESGEKMPEMMTVYHLDGDRLLLTHYCMAGNQPRMQARAFDAETGAIDFQFLDVTNLSNPNAAYMHNAKLRLIDSNHIANAWTLFENGKAKRTETAQYTRIK